MKSLAAEWQELLNSLRLTYLRVISSWSQSHDPDVIWIFIIMSKVLRDLAVADSRNCRVTGPKKYMVPEILSLDVLIDTHKFNNGSH